MTENKLNFISELMKIMNGFRPSLKRPTYRNNPIMNVTGDYRDHIMLVFYQYFSGQCLMHTMSLPGVYMWFFFSKLICFINLLFYHSAFYLHKSIFQLTFSFSQVITVYRLHQWTWDIFYGNKILLPIGKQCRM